MWRRLGAGGRRHGTARPSRASRAIVPTRHDTDLFVPCLDKVMGTRAGTARPGACRAGTALFLPCLTVSGPCRAGRHVWTSIPTGPLAPGRPTSGRAIGRSIHRQFNPFLVIYRTLINVTMRGSCFFPRAMMDPLLPASPPRVGLPLPFPATMDPLRSTWQVCNTSHLGRYVLHATKRITLLAKKIENNRKLQQRVFMKHKKQIHALASKN
ncbi:hypothetical protein BS78_05G260200 [Paspalum vaginatum]|nr:hypothetical protein BS78_05G260200 [Paspalum vaginatum]